MDLLIWLGILFCISQSAMFSGLNLAFFGISRLRLEVEKANGNPAAETVLQLREDSNYLLVTILWGNVGVNVLLTLLSHSVLAGVFGFLFSTFVITLAGGMAALLTPVLKLYQSLLYPVAKPSALLLDWWLGKESIQYFREKDIREILRKHIAAGISDIDHFEGVGAMNFLAIDDLLVIDEGERIDPRSIITLPEKAGKLIFPHFSRTADDPFLQQVAASGRKWVILIDAGGQPRYALDADRFLRDALLGKAAFIPWLSCHQPFIVDNPKLSLGDVILQLKLTSRRAEDAAIDQDVVLVWGEEKKIITGADILGRLLAGVTSPEDLRQTSGQR